MYNFEIHFNQVRPTSPLICIKAIFISKICIIAKNSKFGGFYFSKYISHIKGSFKHTCGSNKYPYLNPRTKTVVLQITNFPIYPVLDNIYSASLGESGLNFLQHIKIKNINYD